MSLVNFTLSEEGVGAFNDALACIIKFSDDVSLEFKKDKVRSRIPRVYSVSPGFCRKDVVADTKLATSLFLQPLT